MFNIEVNRTKKIFFVTVSGFFKEDEANAFIEDYKAKLETINPNEYNLLVDGKELKVSARDMLPILGGILKMYIENGFKMIYMFPIGSPTAMKQLENLGKEEFFGKVAVIEDVSEIR